MEDCKFLEKCPMFQILKSESSHSILVELYCRREGRKCARKALRDEGKGPEAVPTHMLPNGEYLNL